MIIQFLLVLFLLFALSRVVVQVRSGKLTIGGFLFWTGLFVFALLGVVEPNLTSHVAKFLGIGRGTDVVLYLSIATIFYLIFRLSISLEDMRREITELVRKIALNREKSEPNSKKRVKQG